MLHVQPLHDLEGDTASKILSYPSRDWRGPKAWQPIYAVIGCIKGCRIRKGRWELIPSPESQNASSE